MYFYFSYQGYSAKVHVDLTALSGNFLCSLTIPRIKSFGAMGLESCRSASNWMRTEEIRATRLLLYNPSPILLEVLQNKNFIVTEESMKTSLLRSLRQ